MDDAALVGGADGVGQRDGQLEQARERHAVLGNQLRQRLPLDELHGEEVHVAGLLDRVDGDDVGVVERGDGLGLALEALAALAVGADRGWEHLEGDAAVEVRILGRVDLAHAAVAEGARDPVVVQRQPDHAASQVAGASDDASRGRTAQSC